MTPEPYRTPPRLYVLALFCLVLAVVGLGIVLGAVNAR